MFGTIYVHIGISLSSSARSGQGDKPPKRILVAWNNNKAQMQTASIQGVGLLVQVPFKALGGDMVLKVTALRADSWDCGVVISAVDVGSKR